MSEERLLDYAIQVVAAEEAARATARELAKGITVQITPEVVVKPEKRRTIVEHRKDIGPGKIIDRSGPGVLKELMLKASHQYYGLRVEVDGLTAYDMTWSQFSDISQEVSEVSAFQDTDGNYVLHLEDIKFSNSLAVYLISFMTLGQKLTLSEALWKLEVVS
jgi:hypothetical protein